jgi:hypothetical protein
MPKSEGPRTLIVDIETSPLIVYSWGVHDQYVGLNQVVEDWYILSFSAKWKGENKVIYRDSRDKKDISNDKHLVEELWDLLDEADIVIGQNSKRFDIKKINARFAIHKMKPPSSFKQEDTCQMAGKHFGFTSNSLDYLTEILCTKHKKSKHNKFPGMSLWKECLKGNMDAWKAMEKYNKKDVLCTEELFEKLSPWGVNTNINLFTDEETNLCSSCGSNDWSKNGIKPLASGLYQRYVCKCCGYETRGKVNLLPKEKRESLKPKVTR